MDYIKQYASEKAKYEEFKNNQLKMDISRGKPSKKQIDYVSAVFKKAENEYDLYEHRVGDDKQDLGNYGLLLGITELRTLFGSLLDISSENIIIGGNSSLSLMYDMLTINLMFGNPQSETPWNKAGKIKFLCPTPGYDRHFMMTEHLGFEMINIPIYPNGPDMDMVESLAGSDPSIKGIWCTPLYSNPDGYVYSDDTVIRLSKMHTAAKDFRIFWDNAYFTHHLVPKKINRIANIIKLCEEYGNPDRVYQFSSTSKISFPGAGVSLIASSKNNIKHIQDHFKYKIICYDKMNMLRHAIVFKTKEDVELHMENLSEFNRPKFKMVLDILDRELTDYKEYLHYTRPEGGYFISLYTMENCAKKTYELCKEAGLIITNVGDTYPYGKDPKDSNIRIAPTFPEIDELEKAINLLVCCVKLAILEKLVQK
ncbi:MAG: aminotransferase class I/II-fold pyridoxal phosphate-dependent enzyme [Clostridiaceae bacterium]|jgi:DNA-binding transcriptional MocR family regulator|nr:aminotransferase class I/II-fold pyridoxal phosphate-dependent enzyme [Clostridia bacterium]NLV34794.1 aminotransferase class I/II-fold pyridoxal phosphate-dependent enzyme [Clostridiaceae bacterium]